MKPIFYLSAKDSFDASLGKTFTFAWGGNQAVQNRLKIYNNETLDLVYDATETTQKLSHTIPANVLTNNVTYKAVISVYDVNNVESDESEATIFTTYTTPSFSLSINDGDTIVNSSYDVSILYSQPEGEELQEYQVELYKNGTFIWSSGIQYDITEPINIVGLEDTLEYEIFATGRTLHNMLLQTTKIKFYVSYENKGNFVVCNLTNIPDIGAIRAESNIIVLDGECDIEEVYTRDNTCLDITNGTVIYNKNLAYGGDWKQAVKFYITEESLNKKILTITDNTTLTIYATLRRRYKNQSTTYYFEVIVESPLYRNCYHTQCIDTLDKEITLWITNKDCLYDVYLFT